MSQSSANLAEQLKDMGVPFKRGVKVTSHFENKRTRNEMASDVWLYRWAKNSYRNYPIVSRAKGVTHIADSCTGVPVVIVGVGPSLDDSLSILRGCSGKALLLSTDAAFRPLMANGIRPDLVISYDCKPEQSLLWESVPSHDVPILFDSCSNPAAIASWDGPVLFYNHWHQADELSKMILPHVNPHIGQLPSGGTVGNVALLLSKLMGCAPAIVVGMDFCYGYGDPYKKETWRYRSRDYRFQDGKWFEKDVVELYDNDMRLARSYMKQINGESYRVDPELAYYLETFLSFVSHFKVETINCSTEGALRDSLMTVPIANALARYCHKPVDLSLFKEKIASLGPDPRLLQ